MKVLLFAGGSRGDVQPYVALARALGAAGHEATLVTPAVWEYFAKQNNVCTIPLTIRRQNTSMDPNVVSRALQKRSAFRCGIKLLKSNRIDNFEMLNGIREAGSGGADIVVHQAQNAGMNIAEWLDVPAIPVLLQPFWIRTRVFPQPDFPIPVPTVLNGLSYGWANWHARALERARYRDGELARWRREELGLRRRSQGPFRDPAGGPRTVLQAFSRHALPAPLDYPSWVHTTGFWFLPASPDWTPPRQLHEFLAGGEPPVYVGLGSAGGLDPRRTTRVIMEALRLARVRAVVNAASGGIVADELGDDVLAIEDAPYDWLFPRMSAIIHAGGSGTTASALASGRPQVVCPILADQPFWAQRMYVSGVAGSPLPERNITPDALAHAIRSAVTDEVMKKCAEEIGQRVRAEEGLATAIKVLESLV